MKKINGIISIVLIAVLTQGCATTGKKSRAGDKAAEYYAQLGVGYLQRNRLKLAKENLEKALSKDRNSAEAQHYYALLQDRLGDRKQAANYFQRAVRNDPKNPELLNNYGSFLCKVGNIQQAEAAFLRATKDPLYRTPEFAFTNAGICLKKQGNYPKAEQYFRKALDLRSDFASALFHMAELSHLQSENAKAQAFLYRYNERIPHTAETLLLCYKIHRALHENAQSEQCAGQLLAKFPQSQEARELN